MKHLVLTGAQGVGKSMLGEWIDINTGLYQVHVRDEQTHESILKTAYAANKPPQLTYVFITNDNVSYENLSKKDFLIIKLDKVQY